MKLSDICDYATDRTNISALNKSNYISTENMLPNKSGITVAATLPTTTQIPAYKIDDVLVSNIRPYFKKIWKANFDGGCSADVLVFRAKENVNSDFLYYVLSSDKFFEYSMATSKGTKMPRGDKKSIMEFEVPNFDFPTQKKIAEVLSCLDTKIELNRRINENLEQQAQAIFKEWFVDFGPFQNKEFIESEYGKIPKDWSYYKLEDLCEVITKGTTPTTLGKKFTETGINFIKGESILEDHSIDCSKVSHIDDETHNLLARSKIATDDIVFTIAGTLGRFMIIDDTMIPANTNQAVAIIRPQKEKIHPLVLYSYFIADWHNTFYTKNIQQSVQANLSLTTIKSLPILLPKNNILEKYEKLVIPIFSTIKQNQLENRKLAEIRDTLLPKLMSGELEV